MKNRMPSCCTGIAMFISMMALVPGAVSAVGYKNAGGASGSVPLPRFNQPVGCARPAPNTYSGDSTGGAVLTLTGGTTTTGSGTVTIASENTYFGGSIINASMLTISRDFPVLQAGCGTLVLNGGILNGAGSVYSITMGSGSILSAGNTPGTMDFNSSLVLSSNSTNTMQIWDESTYDIFNGNGAGTLTLDGYTVFDFTGWNSGAITNGTTFDLFQNWGVINSDGLTYSVLGLADGQQVDFSGGSLTVISDANAAGAPPAGDMLVSVIPEPASAMMLIFGAAAGMVIHRARRSAMRI